MSNPSIHDVENVNGFPRYSPGEMRRRHDGLDRIMQAHDLEMVVIGGATAPLETSIQYFSNWPPLVESYLVWRRGGDPTLVVRLWNHVPDAERVSVVSDVRYGGDTPPAQAATVAEVVRSSEHNIERVGLIGPIRLADAEVFTAELPTTRLVDLSADYRALRTIKSEEELLFTRIAAAMNDDAVAAMQAQIRPGINEYEMARIVEDVYLAQRGTNLIHFTLTTPMAAPEFCVPHQYHPDRVVQAGDVVVTEISTNFWGYAGQILRTFSVAADPTPLYQDLHDTAVDAYTTIRNVLRPGTTVGDILDTAEVIHQAGFSIYDDLVHGFGGAYLPPIIRTRRTRGATHPDDHVYAAGTVLVVQPNVITPDLKAGVQVGNALHITNDGVEELQHHPLEFLRCG